jgi:hypothetical protein
MPGALEDMDVPQPLRFVVVDSEAGCADEEQEEDEPREQPQA